MKPHDRLSYSPIVGRPRLVLPGGARMVVWVIVNVEEWDIDEPMPRTVLTPPAGGQPSPDIPNWAWHEYGNRVGAFRLFDRLSALGIRPTLLLNSDVCDEAPEVVAAARSAGYTHRLRFAAGASVPVPLS